MRILDRLLELLGVPRDYDPRRDRARVNPDHNPAHRPSLVNRDRIAEQVARDRAAARELAARTTVPVRSELPPGYDGPLSPAEIAEAVSLGILRDAREADLWPRKAVRSELVKRRGRHRLRPESAGSPADVDDTTALAVIAGVYDPSRHDEGGDLPAGKTAIGGYERILTEQQWRDAGGAPADPRPSVEVAADPADRATPAPAPDPTPAPSPAPAPDPSPSYGGDSGGGGYSGGDGGSFG